MGFFTGIFKGRGSKGNPGGTPGLQTPGPLGVEVARDRWMNTLRAADMNPARLDAMLTGAINGDLVESEALFQLMVDTWDRLGNNLRTLGDRAASVPFSVQACADSAGVVSPEAREKAELMERALRGLRPADEAGELDEAGLREVLAQATVSGHAVVEILWERRDGFVLPRAFKNIGAGYWAYPSAGSMEEDRLRYRPGGARSGQHLLTDFPANQVLLQVVKAHRGHAAVAGRWRPLVKYWLLARYGMNWLARYAELCGIPFRKGRYKSGDTNARAELSRQLEQMGNAGWASLPEGCDIEFVSAMQGVTNLPQVLVRELADKSCDLVCVGQTSNDIGQGGTGSLASSESQLDVRAELLAGVLSRVGKTVSRQLVEAVLRLNYPPDTALREMPVLECRLPEVEDALANIERDKVFLETGATMPRDWFYARHNVPLPLPGEAVLGMAKNAAPAGGGSMDTPKSPAEGRNMPVNGVNEAPAAGVPGEKAPGGVAAAGRRGAFGGLETIWEEVLIQAAAQGAAVLETMEEEGADL